MMTGLTLILTAFLVAGMLLLFFILLGAFHRSRARRLGAVTPTPGGPDAATLPLMMGGTAQTGVVPDTTDHPHHDTHSGAGHSHGHHSAHGLGGHHSATDSGHHGGGGFDAGTSHGGGFDGGGHH